MTPRLLVPSLITLSLAAPLAPEARAGAELDPLRQLAVQDGGRVKPLDTFARELARRVAGPRPFGLDRVAGLEPVEWLLASMASPTHWQAQPIVRVTHAGLRQAAGLAADRDRFSFAELAEAAGLERAVAAARARVAGGAEPSPTERELLELYDTLLAYQAAMAGEAPRLVPRPADPRAAWLAPAELATPAAADVPDLQNLRLLATAIVSGWREGDRPTAAASAASLSRRLAELAPAAYPSESELRREVRYNRLKPFRGAWLLFLPGFLFILASAALGSRVLRALGYAALVAGFLLTSYGLLLRTLIAGRPPLTNMYETIVFVAWGGVAIALAFEAVYRTHLFAACAGLLGTLALVIADSVPIFDGSISPLVPVLRDNTWLTVHVLTIMLGYAALTLAMGLGHLNLGLYFFRPAEAGLQKRLALFLHRTLQVGTLFLALGTLLGGVWASYSWGRFWGWDPKETWALIALLGYLAVLHGRFAGWVKDFGMAVGAILGYLLVLMAWYGVNYVLGTGLHSYGFGSGGHAYVAAFVAFEAAVVAAALARRRQLTTRRAGPAPHPVAAQPVL